MKSSHDEFWKLIFGNVSNEKPRFDIVFHHVNGEKTMWGGKTIGPFKNCHIEGLHNNSYDYLYEGYEMWITDADSKTISKQNIEYVIGAEAQNIIEDGYPLRTKIIDGKLVIMPNFKCSPFGFKSYQFYREYFALDELYEYFGQGKIILFEGRIKHKSANNKKSC